MVLTGMITTREASDLRILIMDCRVSVDDVFTDTEEKSDVEFLAALQHFSDRRKKYSYLLDILMPFYWCSFCCYKFSPLFLKKIKKKITFSLENNCGTFFWSLVSNKT